MKFDELRSLLGGRAAPRPLATLDAPFLAVRVDLDRETTRLVAELAVHWNGRRFPPCIRLEDRVTATLTAGTLITRRRGCTVWEGSEIGIPGRACRNHEVFVFALGPAAPDVPITEATITDGMTTFAIDVARLAATPTLRLVAPNGIAHHGDVVVLESTIPTHHPSSTGSVQFVDEDNHWLGSSRSLSCDGPRLSFPIDSRWNPGRGTLRISTPFHPTVVRRVGIERCDTRAPGTGWLNLPFELAG